jgi:predicted permease
MKWWQIKKTDADLERELRSDLELEEQEQREGGISEEETRYAALRAFGNPTLIREQTRAIWSWNWLGSFARDLRFSLRTLRRTPGFTVIAILVMALGIGANVALFTVVRGVLLKPLPFHDPDRLVMLYEAGLHEDDTAGSNEVSGGMYAEWKKQNRSYSSLALAQGIRVGLSGSGGQLPEKLNSALFSWDLLRTLGVQPALGRDFTQADDNPAASGTVLLSWGLWKRRFGSDPAILNQTIDLDAEPYTVIGVMPAGFDFPDSSTQLWTPVYHDKPKDTMTSFSDHMFSVVGRLKPGVGTPQGVGDLSVISQRIHNAHLNDPFVFRSAKSRPLLEHIVGEIKKPLYVLLEATGCLLLIACLNVANLLVARAAARRKELAIRSALGGGWLRLIGERLIECLLLSASGGVLGLLFAFAALQWLTQTRHDMSRVQSIHIDGVVAAFTVGVIVLCALFSGLIAAFSISDKRILGALHEASRSVRGSSARATLRRVLLTVEVGLTVILLIGAGLLLKSYERLRSADMGCITQDVITMHLGLPDARYATPAQRANFYDTLLDRVRALPGVDAAGFATVAPGQGPGPDWTFSIAEHPPLPQGSGLVALSRWADAKYFGAMGIPILRGRTFDGGKRLDAANEVIISQILRRPVLSRRRSPGPAPPRTRAKCRHCGDCGRYPLRNRRNTEAGAILPAGCRGGERRHACDSLQPRPGAVRASGTAHRLRDGPRSARLRWADHEPVAQQIDRGPELQHRAARRVRHGVAGSCRGGPVRRDVLHRSAADDRNRHPRRAGRKARTGDAKDVAGWNAARCLRSCRRTRGKPGSQPVDARLAL